jgi:hypothetical protein
MSHPQARRPRVLTCDNCLLQPNFGEFPFQAVSILENGCG